jgi:DNA-binding NtrC family response regulator
MAEISMTFSRPGDHMYISKSLARQISKLTATKGNLLILGEPGVGKRTIAQEIQSKSTKKGEPLVIEGL